MINPILYFNNNNLPSSSPTHVAEQSPLEASDDGTSSPCDWAPPLLQRLNPPHFLLFFPNSSTLSAHPMHLSPMFRQPLVVIGVHPRRLWPAPTSLPLPA